MKKLLILMGLSVVLLSFVKISKEKQISYIFEMQVIWNGEFIDPEYPDEGESIDNATQYFSENEDYVGLSSHGGYIQILDFQNQFHYYLDENKTVKTAMQKKNKSNIVLAATTETANIQGYETIKYTWKDDKGNYGEIWYATQLKFPAMKKGYAFPVFVEMPLAPEDADLGIPLKTRGHINGQDYNFEVSSVDKSPQSYDINPSEVIEGECCFQY